MLDQLLAAATGLQARAWCISQAGFTSEALAFAAEKGILVSNAEDLAALARWVKQLEVGAQAAPGRRRKLAVSIK